MARREGNDDAAESLDFELQLQQLETNSRPSRDLSELGQELRRCRALAVRWPPAPERR